ncbi:transcriptional regulator [Izhakiella australiensis]|uniref:Transcriptional regulator n=1 Tax=Izhakiella australiensis TaxID=1926881 RepID=A0A1S8YNS0_9GAMM|nr:XRE family transcriptional regulator [Izhakiella australiensis]OON40811.1 transcriptional regulator [Izhakiella australiensis]
MNTPIAMIAHSLVRERQRKGLSQGELARQAGVAKSTLSQLEAGNGNPSIETLWSLCVALDIPFANLMMEPQITTRLVRRGEGLTVAAEQADYQAILLATCPPGARRDIYQVESQPGNGRCSLPHLPGTVEHIIITHGRALVGLSDRPVELNVGDYLCYPADHAHIFRALEADTRAVMIIEHV